MPNSSNTKQAIKIMPAADSSALDGNLKVKQKSSNKHLPRMTPNPMRVRQIIQHVTNNLNSLFMQSSSVDTPLERSEGNVQFRAKHCLESIDDQPFFSRSDSDYLMVDDDEDRIAFWAQPIPHLAVRIKYQKFDLKTDHGLLPKKTAIHIQQFSQERYLRKFFLGRGSCGEVFKCEWVGRAGPSILDMDEQCPTFTDIDGRSKVQVPSDIKSEPFALKRALNKNSLQQSDPFSEARILGNCAHPSIVAFIGDEESEGRCNLYMEVVNGVDLSKKIEWHTQAFFGVEYFNEKYVLRILVQMCFALEYLHRYNILHGDLNPSNVLLNEPLDEQVNESLDEQVIVKLCDFEFAMQLDASFRGRQSITPVGRALYAAPEMHLNGPCNDKADMWSLGAILYELCTLKKVFDTSMSEPGSNLGSQELHDQHGMMESIGSIVCSKPHAPVPEKISSDIRVLIDDLLKKNPDDRPSAREVLRRPTINKAAQLFIKEYEKEVLNKSPGFDQRALTIFQEQYQQIMDIRHLHLSGAQYVSEVMQQNRQILSVVLEEQMQRNIIQSKRSMEMHTNQNSFFGILSRLKNSTAQSNSLNPSTACAFGKNLIPSSSPDHHEMVKVMHRVVSLSSLQK